MAQTLDNTDFANHKPSIIVNGRADDDSNGTIPEPFERYGKSLPKEWIPLYKKPMRTPTRRLRVVTIGGGISAMTLAYKIYHEHRMDELLDFIIYEANEDLGGTWLVNTYPGVSCDVPAHTYTFPFEPNPDWSEFYASGKEIQEYFKRTVTKYDLARDVKTGHRVEKAEFDEENGKWKLEIKSKDGVVKDECDILVSATGFLSNWKWPSILGLHSFKGHLLHSAIWSKDFDPTDKRIAVIGNGSSAIQIVPQLVEKAKHLTNFVRRPTYITPGLGTQLIGGKTQHYYTEEERRNFRENPEELKAHRKKIQHATNANFALFVKGSKLQEMARKQTAIMMKDHLGGDEELAKKLVPEWEVGCRRATPGLGYLEAYKRDNVSLVSESIERIEETGIRTVDGKLYEFDAIVCATGFDVSHRPSWPLIGRRGQTLAESWAEQPLGYLSLAATGFPNFMMFSGPNALVGHGSLLPALGWGADWMCQWIRKISEEDILWVDVKQEASDEFNAYADEIMQTLVWSGGCQSWYKNHSVDGKVTAVWAGSAIGHKEMIDHIRAEDFDIKYRSKNRWRFMGNGRASIEYQPDADLAFYL